MCIRICGCVCTHVFVLFWCMFMWYASVCVCVCVCAHVCDMCPAAFKSEKMIKGWGACACECMCGCVCMHTFVLFQCMFT